jgi:hypothetical protein
MLHRVPCLSKGLIKVVHRTSGTSGLCSTNAQPHLEPCPHAKDTDSNSSGNIAFDGLEKAPD